MREPGSSALVVCRALLATYPAELILLDLRLREMSGYELPRRLKDEPTTRSIPIVAVTAPRGSQTTRKKAREAGRDGYITKPISTILLPFIVDRYLRAV